jgi:hypothetical protein
MVQHIRLSFHRSTRPSLHPQSTNSQRVVTDDGFWIGLRTGKRLARRARANSARSTVSSFFNVFGCVVFVKSIVPHHHGFIEFACCVVTDALGLLVAPSQCIHCVQF